MNPFEIERLDFRLHDFTRFSWTSDQSRTTWEPIFAKVLACWQELEVLSVKAGLRSCAQKLIPARMFPQINGHMAEQGLCVEILDRIASSKATYTTFSKNVKPGADFNYQVVLGSSESVKAFKQAWDENKHEEIRLLLGYPECCAAFFKKVWVDEKFIDTSWAMAFNTGTKKKPEERTLELNCSPQSNILLRWLGLRAVPHLPCAFDCTSTINLGNQYLALGREEGYKQEMDWLEEILSWPVEWSALHGIAEIKIPILKINATTDATAEKYTLRYKGTIYPEEALKGLIFPYGPPQTLRITNSKSFHQGLANPI